MSQMVCIYINFRLYTAKETEPRDSGGKIVPWFWIDAKRLMTNPVYVELELCAPIDDDAHTISLVIKISGPRYNE